mgnify:CR=1 FL=1
MGNEVVPAAEELKRWTPPAEEFLRGRDREELVRWMPQRRGEELVPAAEELVCGLGGAEEHNRSLAAG